MSPSGLQITSESSIEVIQSLEAALTANNIQVRQGAIQELLNQRHWIYSSERIENLLEKLTEDQLYSIFNSKHHLESAAGLFEFLRYQESCVLYGHKAQGKTQFLFFVFRLLQAMGEKVIFLDRSMLPSQLNNKIRVNSINFCGNWWKDSFLNIEGPVNDTLKQFYQDSRPESFGIFNKALRQLVRSTGTRIWIIVDEVVLFQHFPIYLPDEQNMGPFNWIITGSAGMGSWVAKRHLEKLVFDLPLFTKDESTEFATNLCRHLNINLEDALGVPSTGTDDWLEERFGGVVGYISEMLLEVCKGSSASQYIIELSGRVRKVINDSAIQRHISIKELAEDWLNEIQSNDNQWDCLRDTGLCGSSSPRGVIFTKLLKWLFIFYPPSDELKLVRLFRSRLSGDPGLDGCLLELEEIIKLIKASHSISASLFTLVDQKWICEKSIDLPSKGSSLNVMVYEESQCKLVQTMQSTSSSWTLIEVPSGFDVIDVVLVNTQADSLSAIYGIQITLSSKPFAKHHSFDTCPSRSSEKLNKLWGTISNHFKLDDTVMKYYVILAPNCKKEEFRPPVGHSSDFYFSPSSIITQYDQSICEKSSGPSLRKRVKKSRSS